MKMKELSKNVEIVSADKPDSFEYDVAISFAGEDRIIAEKLDSALRGNGVSVFYDDFYKSDLWGKKLTKHFQEVYGRKARFVIMLISKYYPAKDWTDLESSIAMKEAKRRKSEFILPVKLDDSKILGIHEDVMKLDFNKEGIDGIVKYFLEKLLKDKKHSASGSINPADKKEVDLLLGLLQNPNTDVQKSAAIDLENLSQRKAFADPHHVEELIKIIEGLNINKSDQNALDAGLHTAKLPQEPPTLSGLMLLLMETLYNVTIYAEQSKNDTILNKIKEYTKVLANIAFDTSPYAKWYDRYLPQIRAVMILYYINNNKAIDALLELLEIDEYVEIPSFKRGVQYNSELVDACLLLSDKHGIEIKRKLYELVGNPNKNISDKAQSILKDL